MQDVFVCKMYLLVGVCFSKICPLGFSGLPWLGYVACLFAVYVCMTMAIKQTNATSVNISILSADFYSLLFGLFLFHYQVSNNCFAVSSRKQHYSFVFVQRFFLPCALLK